MFSNVILRFKLALFGALFFVVIAVASASDDASDSLFRQMEPVTLTNCALLLREPLSFSNLRNFTNEFGGIRFVIGVDKHHAPILFLLQRDELHDAFARAHFDKATDFLSGAPKLIYGIMSPIWDERIPTFYLDFHGARRGLSAEAFQEVSRLLHGHIQIPQVTFIDINDTDVEFTLKAAQGSDTYREGWAIGRLRFANADELPARFASGDLKASDILVLDRVPHDMQAVAGIISQTPNGRLSHIELMAGMLEIPFAYISAEDLSEYKKFDGQIVVFQTASRKTTPIEIEGGAKQVVSYWKIVPAMAGSYLLSLQALKNRKPIAIPEPNVTFSEIRSLQEIQPDDLSAVGAKATNLGFLMHSLGSDHVPAGIAVPFHYFTEFLQQSTFGGVKLAQYIDARLQVLLSQEASTLSFLQIDALLHEVRFAISNARIPQSLLNLVLDGLNRKLPKSSDGFLWRSSSSAEDGDRFNGAGLYGSVISAGSSPESVELALKEVWSTLYSSRAFYARRLFQIDEARVNMAVVVHPKHEEPQVANGVSTLSWYEGYEGPSVTHAILGGNQVLVTSPTPGFLPEVIYQVLMAQGRNAFDVLSDVISAYLSHSTFESLNKLLARLAIDWAKTHRGDADEHFGAFHNLDVEWYVVQGQAGLPDRVVIRQVRRHPTPYQHDQLQLETVLSQ